MIPMMASDRDRIFKIAWFALLGSLFGAIAAYFIGMYLFESIGMDILNLYDLNEEIIEQHYSKQIDQLDKIDTDLQKKISKFRNDEAHHKETGNKNSDKSHPILKKLINKTTEAAIFLAERT